MTEPSLRDACDGDWPFVERLYVEALVESHAYGEADAAVHVGKRSVRWKLDGAYAIVAIDAEQRLGVVWVLQDSVAAGCDYVQLIAADRPYRRRRIAEALLRAAIERSRRRGRERLRAGVHCLNRPSLRLFEALGFRAENADAELLMMSFALGASESFAR